MPKTLFKTGGDTKQSSQITSCIRGRRQVRETEVTSLLAPKGNACYSMVGFPAGVSAGHRGFPSPLHFPTLSSSQHRAAAAFACLHDARPWPFKLSLPCGSGPALASECREVFTMRKRRTWSICVLSMSACFTKTKSEFCYFLVQAVWAGWGHASENPKLPELLHKNGIAFMGEDVHLGSNV